MSFFSKNLEYLRTSKKMSRAQLADKINVNQSTISRWENEDMGVTVENAYDVANFFNISISDLVGKDLTQENNRQINHNKTLNILYDKIKDLPEDKQKIILNVTEAVMKDIDEQLDGKDGD